MMTLDQTKNKADILYRARENDLIARQTAYVGAYGVYFQGLDTHDVIPSDGNEKAPDFSKKPTDQESTWSPSDFPPAMPASLRIDCHSNIGYMSILSFFYGGDLYQKQIGYEGVEYISHDWQIVPQGNL